MGLFDRLKKQLLKVIEWTDESSDTIVYKFPVDDRYAIMKNSQLVVRESQVAIFVVEGKIADIFEPGRYKLDDIKNIPILTKIFNWKYAFENPYTGDVYFVNTKQFTTLKWGTTNPIMMRDKDFGVIRLRGYGVYAFKVIDPATLLKELFGTRSSFKTGDIMEHLKKTIIARITDTIAESKIAALDLAMSYDELSAMTKTKLDVDFGAYGLQLTTILIENLSLPEEVEKTLDQRTSLGVLGDKMNVYTQKQAADAMRDAAKNPGNAFAGAGIGLGAGVGMAQMFNSAMQGAMSGNNGGNNGGNGGDSLVASANKAGGIKCPKCNAVLDSDAKFCPECGAKIALKVCAKCGAALDADAKFCPECGTVAKRVCSKCGAELTAKSKFCPECGTKC